jgi:sugar lactone lactonase YvrE
MKRLHGYKALLGEGVIWDHETEKLYWVDIEGKKIIIQDIHENNVQIISLDQKPGSAAPGNNRTIIVALEDGVYLFDPETWDMTVVLPNELPEDTRFNDGKCDPEGRFWVGTTDLEFRRPVGTLYRIDHHLGVHPMLSSIITSNGLAWSPDKRWMYYIDSGTQKIAAYYYNNKTGDIHFHSHCIEIPETFGLPDGCTIDEHGMLWVALWGGHSITRWNPHNGTMIERIDVPALNVTSVAFGGPALDTLFITTAGINTPDPTLYPDAGFLFFLKPGVRGIPAPRFCVSGM